MYPIIYMNLLRRLLPGIALIAGTFLLSVGLQTLAWTPPNGSPPTSSAYAPLNTGPTVQTKNGGLNITGSVGIGTTNLHPQAKLDVNGYGRFTSGMGIGGTGGANSGLLFNVEGSYYVDRNLTGSSPSWWIARGPNQIGFNDWNVSINSGGYIYNNSTINTQDVWLRNANGGAGKWASQSGGATIGSYQGRSLNTIYTETTSGFVVFSGVISNSGTKNCWTSTEVGGMQVQWNHAGGDGPQSSSMAPVPPGVVWRATSDCGGTVWWVPLN